METTSKKIAKFSAALSVGVIFPAGFATQLGSANVQQNKTLMQSQGANLYAKCRQTSSRARFYDIFIKRLLIRITFINSMSSMSGL